MRSEDIVIVGGGPAGCSAAVQCKRLGARPLLLERTGQAGGLLANAFLVENYIGLEPLPGWQMAEKLSAHLNWFDVPLTRGTVTQVSQTSDGFALHGDFGDIRARCVILAVGTHPLPLGIPGVAELMGVRAFYEVRALLDAIPAPREVFVIGGGEAALDYALTLAQAGAKVKIFVRGSRPRVCGRLAELVAGQPAIEIARHSAPVRAHPESGAGFVLEIAQPGGQRCERGDALLIAIGRRSAVSDLAGELGIRPAESVATHVPGLFVAGDARLGTLGQAGIAVGDGLTAAFLATATCAGADADARTSAW